MLHEISTLCLIILHLDFLWLEFLTRGLLTCHHKKKVFNWTLKVNKCRSPRNSHTHTHTWQSSQPWLCLLSLKITQWRFARHNDQHPSLSPPSHSLLFFTGLHPTPFRHSSSLKCLSYYQKPMSACRQASRTLSKHAFMWLVLILFWLNAFTLFQI